ncbi:MAG TPA: hypothetical protein VMN39_09510 [Longimicrobiaceae bacterium]|nr:hypothetical protein [Longimicrobiaceae bacterium]
MRLLPVPKGWAARLLLGLCVALAPRAPVAAQIPVMDHLSAGVLASHLTIAEPHERGDRGTGSGFRFGYPFVGPVSVEARVGHARIDHARVSASYKLWEANFGLRYHFRKGADRLRPFTEALSAVQVGQVDRDGFTPGPDLTGVGAAAGIGIHARLLWGFWLALGAEGGLTWLRHGRVENGDWLRLGDAPAVRMRATRLTAGLSWNP